MEGYRSRFRLWAAALALLGACVGTSHAFAAAPSYPQAAIEAAFLYRFAGFVHWPAGALKPAAFTVAVLNDDTVASDLERMMPRDERQGRRVRVRRITNIGQLDDARILFIGESDAAMLRRWLARVAGRPVLVVTNQPGGLEAGSTINFLLVNRHVRFEISLNAARRSGLAISADLLSVAMHVQGHPVGSESPCGFAAPTFEPPVCPPRLAAR
jgi:YfiR/HmsC-like